MGWVEILLKIEQMVLPQATAAARASRRAAKEIWDNQCRWGWTSQNSTGRQWLSTSNNKAGAQGFARVEHVSAHKALGRNAMVDHWVDFLDETFDFGIADNPAVIARWSNIEHDAFWKKLAQVFVRIEEENPETPFHVGWQAPWKSILRTAGECGNLSPYRACPSKELALHAPGISRPHPAVGLWLERQGFATKEQLVSWVDEMSMPLFYSSDRSFGGSVLGEQVTPEFVAQWCKLFLAEYGLPIEKKIRVVAHVVYAFGLDAWATHVLPLCESYLSGIELPLVYAVCGVNTSVSDRDSDGWKLLQTVVELSQNPEKVYEAQLEVAIGQEYRHANLAILCELAGPKDRIDLYFSAYSALQIDRGNVESIEPVELPALDIKV